MSDYNIEEYSLAAYLADSILFDAYLIKEFPNVNVLAHLIHDSIPALASVGIRDKIRLIQTITNVLLNLYIGYSTDKRIAISLNKNDYVSGKRYKKLYFQYRPMKAVIENMYASNYINLYPGYKTKTGGRMTRIEASETLINMFQDYELEEVTPESLIDLPMGDCIVMHKTDGKKKLEIDYSDNDYTKQARIDLERYNQWLDLQGVQIPMVKSQLRLSGKLLRRVFNDDFEHGGRFYAGYQGLTFSEETRDDSKHYPGHYYRKDITFGGEKSVELDFSSLHPNMCYHMNGMNLQGKAYQIGEFEKAHVKILILICFNAESELEARRAWVTKMDKAQKKKLVRWIGISDLHKRFVPMAEAFKTKHSQISNFIYSGIGTTLQFHDSNIMNSILQNCMVEGIPALPVHDSIIVPESKKEQARTIMLACYQEYMIKTFNLTITPEIAIEEK